MFSETYTSRFKTNYEIVSIGTALIVIATLSFGTSMMRKRKQQELEKKKDNNRVIVSIELSQQESTFYMVDMPAMTTITWFKGDFRLAQPQLEKRMRLMVEKNPWLQGRISMKSFLKGKYQLSYNRKEDLRQEEGEEETNDNTNSIDITENLVTLSPSESPISRDSPMEDLGVLLLAQQKAIRMIKNGPTEPIFRATIIPCSKDPHEKFSVMIQLSHVVGDGATYYRLIHMLLSTDEDTIVKLDPIRITDSQKLQIAAMGKEEEGHVTSIGYTLRLMRGLAWSKLLGRPVSFQFGWVDPVKMKQAKETAANEAGLPFVSSNDVITSWFMNQTACPMGVMAINWRNRLKGHTASNAGNYENVMFYQPSDYASAGLIRKSLDGGYYKRAVTSNEKMPGWFQVATTSGSVVTNWSTFAQRNEIEGCEEDLHLPVGFIDYWASTMPLLLVFRAGVNKIGLCYFHTSGPTHFDSAPFLLKEEKETD